MGKVQQQVLLWTRKTLSVLALGFVGPLGSFWYLHTSSTSDHVSSGRVGMYQIILYRGLVQFCTWYYFLLKIVFGQLTVYRGSSIPARPPWHTAFAPMMKVIRFNIGRQPLDVDGVFNSAHIETDCTIIINL